MCDGDGFNLHIIDSSRLATLFWAKESYFFQKKCLQILISASEELGRALFLHSDVIRLQPRANLDVLFLGPAMFVLLYSFHVLLITNLRCVYTCEFLDKTVCEQGWYLFNYTKYFCFT